MPPSTWDLMQIDNRLERMIESLQEALERAEAATSMDCPVDAQGTPFLDPVDDSPAASYPYAVGILSAQIEIAMFDLINIRKQMKELT
ncbi:hypothetical protein SXBG_00045 [Synechococcus phage S-CAM1]|uniref:Uncharacterized protein n=1 Tax=Synechococcus phage S-CAM1 TaxID=754037 RepID=M4QIM1_9CAUD|nr:hypothetical protein SXBG_00045 [Synechococcus phage S-CAM1]AGH26782.1 hypothetical protein SXBG_00045 [Synechococcus phage S-CAM1]AOV57304.1 hypothetical protein N330309_049 [Synechococcus phage S-CAM1]AOV57554.1 hypothetical protein N170310_049 [Synechococcus phage S-CAM1]AOV57804.1 hypothetical protein C030809_049 [Synechococcus phage S-CAM1]AOV58054.1 hypothetical protein S170810_049 [Synechococcus phage S-CAM1]